MQRTIHTVAAQADDGWPALTRAVADGLESLLTPAYLASRRTAPRYRVRNDWRIAPVVETADWLLSSRSKHCTVERV